jgi:GntR family transcriptional regulator/MocR family aminotransferase
MPARSDPRRHAGSRQGSLPRALAEELGVARNTVLYAYEQLASEGL